MNDIENEIIRLLAIQDVSCFNCGIALPSKYFSEVLEIDYDEIKKIMRKLRNQGYIVYENKSYSVCEDYEMQEFSTFRNRGWLLTDKARTLNVYIEEYDKEKAIFNECFKCEGDNNEK